MYIRIVGIYLRDSCSNPFSIPRHSLLDPFRYFCAEVDYRMRFSPGVSPPGYKDFAPPELFSSSSVLVSLLEDAIDDFLPILFQLFFRCDLSLLQKENS